MTKYIYGASVQGIQSFIFQTNKLKEIVGASELVEDICRKLFKEMLLKHNIAFVEENLLVGAAGSIKYIFESKEDCEKIVKTFPKTVMEKADGITISQAVVQDGIYEDAIQELERRLRIQRNKHITISDNLGWMVTETARRTGGVGINYSKQDVLDKGQIQKLEAHKKANHRLIKDILESNKLIAAEFPFDISDIIKGQENQSWVAVIHVDGNSLGKKLIKMGKKLDKSIANRAFKDFSTRLDKATKEAAKYTFETVVLKIIKKEGLIKIPFRPVLLGGDDFTAIIRGDIALEFTQSFLKAFEAVSKSVFTDFDAKYNIDETLFSDGLTSCAGIAYIKANYPFHYGIKLAENLCQVAKNGSKSINDNHSPSSLMFHKVQASFIESFEDIVKKELTGVDNVFFNHGPYFINPQEGFDTVDALQRMIKELNYSSAPKSGLRNWLSELRYDAEKANQTLERIASLNSKSDLNKKYITSLRLKEPNTFTHRKYIKNGEELIGKFTPIYDAMSLSNI